MQPINLQRLLDRGEFPQTAKYLHSLTRAAKAKYESYIRNFTPSWWGRMALSTGPGGGGGLLIRKVPGGLEIYYANAGKYNYLEVVEKGRGTYDMKPALLRSPRARTGKNGRYIIIPMTRNKDRSEVNDENNTIHSVVRRTGHYMDREGKKRIKYGKVEDRSGRGNVYAFEQGPVKSGEMQYSYAKFLTVSENSSGWIQKPIQGARIEPEIQKEVDKTVRRDPRLQEAISRDVEKFLTRYFD